MPGTRETEGGGGSPRDTCNARGAVIAGAGFNWLVDVSRVAWRADRLAGVQISFQMLPEQPAAELLDAIAAADRLGYYACYSADEIYHKDAWLLFAAAAQRTERIRLGPCVAPIYMREPTYIAQLAATLDELSDGRAEVVFGIGNIAMLEQYGVEWRGTRPIARLREAHHVMRTVLDEGAIDFEGDFYRYTGVTTASRPVQEHLPLKISAMGGPKSMELAGEIADGLHTACVYSPEALDYAVEHLQAGVERVGRNPEGLDLGDSLLGGSWFSMRGSTPWGSNNAQRARSVTRNLCAMLTQRTTRGRSSSPCRYWTKSQVGATSSTSGHLVRSSVPDFAKAGRLPAASGCSWLMFGVGVRPKQRSAPRVLRWRRCRSDWAPVGL